MTTLAALFGLDDRPDWTADALCAQMPAEMFFVDKGGNVNEPKTICSACPARARCLTESMLAEYGDSHTHRHGVYGGLSPMERQRLERDGWQLGDPAPAVRIGRGGRGRNAA